jgi:hypothetical protein
MIKNLLKVTFAFCYFPVVLAQDIRLFFTPEESSHIHSAFEAFTNKSSVYKDSQEAADNMIKLSFIDTSDKQKWTIIVNKTKYTPQNISSLGIDVLSVNSYSVRFKKNIGINQSTIHPLSEGVVERQGNFLIFTLKNGQCLKYENGEYRVSFLCNENKVRTAPK